MESPIGALTVCLLPSGLTKVTLIVFFAAAREREEVGCLSGARFARGGAVGGARAKKGGAVAAAPELKQRFCSGENPAATRETLRARADIQKDDARHRAPVAVGIVCATVCVLRPGTGPGNGDGTFNNNSRLES
jgi:hypothetical protein